MHNTTSCRPVSWLFVAILHPPLNWRCCVAEERRGKRPDAAGHASGSGRRCQSSNFQCCAATRITFRVRFFLPDGRWSSRHQTIRRLVSGMQIVVRTSPFCVTRRFLQEQGDFWLSCPLRRLPLFALPPHTLPVTAAATARMTPAADSPPTMEASQRTSRNSSQHRASMTHLRQTFSVGLCAPVGGVLPIPGQGELWASALNFRLLACAVRAQDP